MDYLPDIVGANLYNRCYRRRLFEKEFQKFWINIGCKWSISAPFRLVPNSILHVYTMNGGLHYRYGPALIQYSSDGKQIEEEYWFQGKKKSYKEYLKCIYASRYSRK